MADYDPLFDKLLAPTPAPAAAPAAPQAAAPGVDAPPRDYDPAFDKLLTPAPSPVIPTEQGSLLHPIDLITGQGRTEHPDRPELTAGDVRDAHGHGRLAAIFRDPAYRQVAIGYLIAPNPEAQMDILQSALHLPKDAFSQDKHGNWM